MALPPPSVPSRGARSSAPRIRREAEARAALEPRFDAPLDATHALHELRVHQIELEMQNEELRRTHLELDSLRARYFDLYDLAPVGYCTLSETGLVVEANLTAVTLLGITRQLALGRTFLRFVVPDDRPTLHALMERVRAGGERRTTELKLVRDDGSQFWGHLVVTTSTNEAGQTERRVVISDVTARKVAEEERQEGEGRYRELFSRASDGIMLCALNGTVVEANEAFARLHGVTVNDLTGLNLRTFDTGQVALAAEYKRRLERGELLTFEVEHRHHAGHAVCLEASLSQVTVGGLPRVLGFYRDVTERKRLHAGLAQTDRLASMGMLAAGVAHEINNPLAYVLMNLESLVEDLPRVGSEPTLLADLIERATSALEGAGRIKCISRSLGAFTRVERVELESVDVNRALERAATMAGNEIRFRAKLVKQLSEVPLVRASDGRLTQVFLNLIMNAAQAIEEGHVPDHTITLRTWATEHDVFAEVSDTGHGISPENLARIFEPFFTTKAVGVGSGLGLAICKNILTELGGELQVESTVGQGTRFVVRLSSAPAVALASPAARALPQAAARVTGGRILVVDDEPSIRRVMERLLAPDYEVVTVASGLEARQLLEHDSAFDIILCDVMMPEMTGMEFHAWLEQKLPTLARRMVFVSGGAFTPNAAAYLERLDNVALTKPFEPAELRRVVGSMLAPTIRRPT